MIALVRKLPDRETEVIMSPFDKWTIDNMDWLTGNEKDIDGNPIKGDGWTLIDVPVDDPQPSDFIDGQFSQERYNDRKEVRDNAI